MTVGPCPSPTLPAGPSNAFLPIEEPPSTREGAASPTLGYYERDPESYFHRTVNIDLSPIYQIFEEKLARQARVLDFGAGSGRDAHYFHRRGYHVDAIEGSASMAEVASREFGINVRHVLMQDFQAESRYDGIWACASLHHLKDEELPGVIDNLVKALKTGGTLFVAVRYGKQAYREEDSQRFFNPLDAKRFKYLFVEDQPELQLCHLECGAKSCHDNRPFKFWLRAMLQKQPVESTSSSASSTTFAGRLSGGG